MGGYLCMQSIVQANTHRFERLLTTESGLTKRATIITLLAEEREKLLIPAARGPEEWLDVDPSRSRIDESSRSRTEAGETSR